MVDYTLEERGGAVVVKLRGSLDAYLRDFTPEVEKTIREKPRHLIVDLSGIDFIGSRGMGLAIARRILLEHGGGIEAGNEPGGVARVTLWLPEPDPAAAADG